MCCTDEKNPVPQGNRAGQDGGVAQARGCLPTYTHHSLTTLLLLQLQLQLQLLLHHSSVLRFTAPRCNPLLFPAPIESTARCSDCFYFLLLSCPAAFDNRGKLPSTVRFKTTRGKTASMGSMTCRSMETSLCERARMQLRETRGNGGSIWRIAGARRFRSIDAEKIGLFQLRRQIVLEAARLPASTRIIRSRIEAPAEP